MRTSEQRHKKILNNLKTAEGKAAQLCQQQSKIRKKLSALYTSLQTAVSAYDESLAATSIESENGEKKPSSPEPHISISSWWRISILLSFDTGNTRTMANHARLRNRALCADGIDMEDSFDLAVPLCQHFLLGTCLNERCLFLHPVSLRSLDSQSNSKKDNHLAWIQSKRSHIHTNEAISLGRSSLINNLNGTSIIVTKIAREKDVDSPSTFDSIAGDLKQDGGDSSHETSRQGRYFTASSNVMSLSHPAAPQSLIGLLASCQAAVGELGFNFDALNNKNTLNISFSPTSLDANRNLIHEIIVGLLFTSASIDLRQQTLRSCLSAVRDFLDRCSTANSIGCPPTLYEDAWTIYLVVLLESRIPAMNRGLQLWRTMTTYLQSQFPLSTCILSLAAAVDWDGSFPYSILHADCSDVLSLSPVEFEITPLSVRSSRRVCSSSILISSLRVINQLEDMCSSGRCEAVLHILCKHLQLPLDFVPADSCASNLKLMSMSMNSVSRDLGFALFFMLFFTGILPGRKLLYLGNSVFYVEEGDRKLALKRVNNLFRRCPNAKKMIRSAFISYFECSDSFWGVGSPAEVTESCIDPLGRNIDIESADLRMLSAVEQSTLWCLSIFLRVCSVADVDTYDSELQRVLDHCDPLLYPGVYHSSNITSPTELISTPAAVRSLTLELLVAIDAYLKSPMQLSSAVLDVTISKVRRVCPLSDSYLTLLDKRISIQDFWKKLNGIENLKSIDCLVYLAEWIRVFGLTSCIVTEDDFRCFSASFVSICNSKSRINCLRAGKKHSLPEGLVHNDTVFLSVMFRQVSTISKIACSSLFESHTTAMHILRLVLTVIEASLSLDDAISTGDQRYHEEEEAGDDIVIGKKLCGKKRKLGLDKDRKSCGNISNIKGTLGCFALFDCVAPRLQHRLLIETLDYLDQRNMLSYSVIDTLFQTSFLFTSLGCPDILLKWILCWFATHGLNDKNTREGEHLMKLMNPKVYLKSSFFIANIFRANCYLLSPCFLSRLSASTLFELSIHFLRSEAFCFFTATQGILSAPLDIDEAAIFYSALLRTYTDPIVISPALLDPEPAVQHLVSDSGSDADSKTCTSIYLRESLFDMENVDDEMLKRFQEKLLIYRESGNESVDFSWFVPKGMGSFPLQSLALFSHSVLYLNLSHNFLNVFPAAILSFTNLVKLNISDNKIQSLPEDFHVSMANLTCLELSFNEFSVFPQLILQLKGLEDLRFNNNSLEYIPTQLKNLIKLQYLDVSNNKLKALNSDLTSLQFLKT